MPPEWQEIGDQHDPNMLGIGLLHPFEDLVVDDPLARVRPVRLVSAKQEGLVEPVGLVVASRGPGSWPPWPA